MVALDAKTGDRVASFGKNGIVDLKQEIDQPIDLVTGEVGLHAAPIIANDVIIIGAAHLGRRRPQEQDERQKGYVRGFDVAHRQAPVDLPHDSAAGRVRQRHVAERLVVYTGNAGVWAQMSVDEELGLVYLPVELPTGDYYGGHRPGNNLFGESIVARRPEDRPAQVALPARAPRHLGHGHPVRADPRGHHRQRPADQGASRSRPSRVGSTCSIARPGSRCGRSKSGRCRRATCPASGTRRRSRS